MGQKCDCGTVGKRVYTAPEFKRFIPRSLYLGEDYVKVHSADEMRSECRKRGLVHKLYDYFDKAKEANT